MSRVLMYSGEFMATLRTIALSSLLVGACATPPPQTASDVVRQVAEHVRGGDMVAASSHLTEQARARGLTWPTSVESEAVPTESRRLATWENQTGAAVRLSHGEQGWRIRTGVLRFLDSGAPEGALG